MPYSTLVCLDDLTRIDTWPTSELVFDLVRLPIFHATGLNIGRGVHRGQASNLLPGFSLATFRQLCVADGEHRTWQQLQHTVPPAAAEHLLAHLPADALVLGHAMPPWLLGLLDGADIAYIDLRQSPLRFGSDLVVGLRSNRPQLHAAASALALSAEQLLAESNLMAARLRLQRRTEGRLRLPNNPCVFVGQTEDDAALVGQDGHPMRVSDYGPILAQLASTGPLLYLPHPRAGDFARIERDAIERAVGRQVPLCELDTYDLLACDDELTLIGLNAGALQEAAWFGRQAYALCPLPATPVFGQDSFGQGWLQIAPSTLMHPTLWARLLEAPVAAHAPAPQAQPNLLRELMNDWWGHAEATQRGHGAMRTAFALAGGQRQADALRRCETELASTRAQVDRLGAEVARLTALVDRQNRRQARGDGLDADHSAGLPAAARQRRASPPRKASAAA